MLKKLNEQNFDNEIKQGTVIVDFYADWCGPCKMLAPILDEIAEEREDVLVGKINVDDSPLLAARFGIVSIPTLIVFENGEEKKKIIGYTPKDEILRLL